MNENIKKCNCKCHTSDRFYCYNVCCFPCQRCGNDHVANYVTAAGGDKVCVECFDPKTMTPSINDIDL